MNVAHRDWSVAMAGLFINIFIRFLFRYKFTLQYFIPNLVDLFAEQSPQITSEKSYLSSGLENAKIIMYFPWESLKCPGFDSSITHEMSYYSLSIDLYWDFRDD